ncbi:MAG: Rieske (2Fe-2S) protein [Anaerolineales bacterium]
MSQAHYVCQLDDLPPDQPRCFRVAERDILLVNYKDVIHAVDNRCGHMSAALHKGTFTDGLIVCGLHGAGYDVATGHKEWDAIIPPPMASYRHSDDPRLQTFGELIESVETRDIARHKTHIDHGTVYVTLSAD